MEEKESKRVVVGVWLFVIAVLIATVLFCAHTVKEMEAEGLLTDKLYELLTTPMTISGYIKTLIGLLVNYATIGLLFIGTYFSELKRRALSSAEIKIYKRAFVISVIIFVVVYNAFKALLILRGINLSFFIDFFLCLLCLMLMSFLNYVLREHALKNLKRGEELQ